MAKRRRPSQSKSGASTNSGSLGEGLDEIGFKPLGHRIIVGRHVVVRPLPRPKWVFPVIEYLAQALPPAEGGGWEHLFLSAYQTACEALICLGHAVERWGGASPVAQPKLPDVLPRWDDLATAVVSLSSQAGLLGYRHFAGARGVDPGGLARPNIRAACGCGPAYLEPGAFRVFESLGLILGGRWTEQAVTILWRDNPDEWEIDFTKDGRFIQACKVAVATLPKDIDAEMRNSATIPQEDIEEWLKHAERGAPTPKTRGDALRSLRLHSCMEIDRLFARRWRFHEGWLSLKESERTLYIPYDPVALSMRREFAKRYLPEFAFLSQ